jgi:epoxide hydrolase-like protein
MSVPDTVRPFTVDIPDEELDELRRCLASTRWPSSELVENRSQSVQTKGAHHEFVVHT